MAANGKSDSAPRRFGRFLGGLMAALLVTAGVYVSAVLLQDPAENKTAREPVSTAPPVERMQSASMEDPNALARMFGAPLPVLAGYPCRGEAGNASWDGSTARVATLMYDGFAVYAVQPAAAAPLLLKEGLEVSLRSDLTVLGLPAMLAQKGDARCLYFSSETAAYALYAPAAEETEALLSLAERLTWTE